MASFEKNKKLKNIWLYLMLFSFFYELPVFYLTNFDRINPRLYDIFFIIGLFLFPQVIISHKVQNVIYKNWKLIVYWFCFCAVAWSVFGLPREVSALSLLFAFRYIQGLLVLKMILLHPKLSFDVIGKVSFVGTIFISLYCLYEYNGGHSSGVYELTSGKYLNIYEDSVFGPLSHTYLHLGQLLPLSVIISLAYIVKNKLNIIWYVVLFVSSWPMFFAGSRAGLFLLIFSLFLFFFLYKKVAWKISPLILVLLFVLVWKSDTIFNLENARTLNRFEEFNEPDSEFNSIGYRLSIASRFDITEYDNGIFMPFIGAGFNAAPVNGNYRVDYGAHSMYLYPFEQAGIVGLFLFLLLLYRVVTFLYKERRYNYYFGALLVYIVGMLCVGLGYQSFWRGSSSGNINTYIVLLMCVAFQDQINKQNKKNSQVSLD